MKGATLKIPVILLVSAVWLWSWGGLVQAGQTSFAVQIASHQDLSRAQVEVEEMKARGYPAFTRPFIVAGKGTWHRVYVGPYSAENQATAAALGLRSQGLIQEFLIRPVAAKKSAPANSVQDSALQRSEMTGHLEKIQAYAPPATPPSPIARQWTSEDQFGANANPQVETRTSPLNQEGPKSDHGATKEWFKNELKKEEALPEPVNNSGLNPAWRVEGGHGQRVTVIKASGKKTSGTKAPPQGTMAPASARSAQGFDPTQGTLVPYIEGGRAQDTMDRNDDGRHQETSAGINWVTDFDLK